MIVDCALCPAADETCLLLVTKKSRCATTAGTATPHNHNLSACRAPSFPKKRYRKSATKLRRWILAPSVQFTARTLEPHSDYGQHVLRRTVTYFTTQTQPSREIWRLAPSNLACTNWNQKHLRKAIKSTARLAGSFAPLQSLR